MQPSGMWWAAMPRDSWGHPEGERPDQKPDWDPRFGDRVQILVFIGQQMDEGEMRARLDACLHDKAVVSAARESWSGLPNPFPQLGMVEESA